MIDSILVYSARYPGRSDVGGGGGRPYSKLVCTDAGNPRRNETYHTLSRSGKSESFCIVDMYVN